MSAMCLIVPLFFLLTAGCAVEYAPPENGAPSAETAAVAPSATRSIDTSAVRNGSPAAKAPTKVPAPPVSVAPPRKKEAPPPLNLTALETRLKETKAIGVFTKITLKNQVDGLLNQFRAYYQGRTKTTLAELRQSYESLILKVLALLQDGDPDLALAIVASREAIWNILADPAKFAALST